MIGLAMRGGLPVAALFLLAVLIYGPTLQHEFAYDDRALIEHNPLLKSLRSIPSLFVADLWSGVGTSHSADGNADDQGLVHRRYRPLPMASYAFNHAVGGSHPAGYHLINVLLHAVTSVLLYCVARELGWSSLGAFIAGVLFVIHPLHTEPVAWVVGRPEMMMSLGLLGALWCHLRGRQTAAIMVFLFALFSKEQAVMFPALVLLADTCRTNWTGPRHPTWRPLVRQYGSYAVVLGLFLSLRMAVLGGLQPDRYPFSENPLEHLDGTSWVLSVIAMAGHYLWLTVWPAALSIDYSYNALPPATNVFDAGVIWAIFAWSSLLGAGLWGWRCDRRMTVAVGFTATTFLPVANLLVPVGTPLAERLFYLPLGGICLLAGLLAEWLAPKAAVERWQRQGALGCGVALALALTVRTELRLQEWKNSEALFRSAVAVYPASARAHFLLGSELLGKGTPHTLREGVDEMGHALAIYPDYVRGDAVFAHNLGVALTQVSRYDEARAALEHAIAQRPRWAEPHHHLGFAYMKLGRTEQAIHTWRTNLSLAPDDFLTRLRLGRLLLQLGRYGEALMEADTAIALDPDYASAHFNRGWALQGLGRLPEARMAYEHVLAMPDAPDMAKAEARRKLTELQPAS